MVWVIAVGLIIIFWFIFPPFRKFVLVVGGLLVVGIIIVLVGINNKEQTAKSLIPSSQIALVNLELSRDYGGGYELSGEVQNHSSHELTSATLDAKAYDCPTNSITPNCTVIGEDKNVYVFIDVPSGQVRSINDTYVDFYGMPSIKGHFLWNYTITGTEGQN